MYLYNSNKAKHKKIGIMTALENQIGKLSQKELNLFNDLAKLGITGEDALNHVLIASALKTI